MPERRTHPRRRKRVVVDFETGEAKTTGFTHDLSRSGLFVRTIRIPPIGKPLRAVLHLPDGGQVAVEGIVVRAYRVPPTLRSLVPSGFGLRLNLCPPEFDDFAASLERSAAAPGSPAAG
jgi:hypothetical protein